MPVKPLGYAPALDGIRGLAILLVVGLHAFKAPRGGFMGVDLFFVLSGFLITTLLLEEVDDTGRISFRGFYERRVRRLLPALLVLLAVYSIVAAARGRSVLPAVAGLFYVTNVLDVVAWKNHALAHLWSLAEEEQFYLVWPPIFLLLARRRRLLAWLLVILLAALVAHRIELVLDHASTSRIDYAPDTRSDGIIVGCLLAVWRREGVPVAPACRWALVVLGPVTAVLALRLHEGARLFHFVLPVVVAGFGALIVVAASGGVVSRLLSVAPAVALGRISYSLYLWHVPILFALGPKIGSGLSVAVSVAVATVSTRYVEARFRRRRVVRFEPVASPA